MRNKDIAQNLGFESVKEFKEFQKPPKSQTQSQEEPAEGDLEQDFDSVLEGDSTG